MPHDPSDDEPRAADLLPPDAPPEPVPRRIAERRVVGWSMAGRLMNRVERRPAGNSRRFWRNIEEDDPFIPRKALRVRRQDEPYPAQRLDRVPSQAPPPMPRESRPAPPPPAPKRMAPAPEPVHSRDPRALTSPDPTPSAPSQPPARPPIDRTPPKPVAPQRSKSGRIRVSRASNAPQGQKGMVRKTADEIRKEKEAQRAPAGPAKPPPLRSLDSVLAALGELQAAEALFKQGIKPEKDNSPPPPKPKKMAQPAPKAEAPPPAPKPTPQPPPVDRSPPKPAQSSKPAAPPKPGGGSGGLDDLFGGGPSEGRARIGKRTKITSKSED